MPSAQTSTFSLVGCIALGALALIATSCTVPRPIAALSGEHLYRQKCANCHGTSGQGVDGKYKEALYGDWGLPRLTRYVAQNMPDDTPATLSPAETDAVSTYVFEKFYSRTAQSKLRPSRVEIAHLTNRQYAVTVADLLGQLGPTPAPDQSAASAGLNVTAYSSAQRGRFESAKATHRGIDPVIDFVFTEDSPARTRAVAATGSAEFSLQWRGAVIADETGDYEFVVRTPNSVRVWFNVDPNGGPANEPTLDINVSNPAHPDHRFIARLIGGRSYPVAIDYWALPEKAGAAPTPNLALRWKPPHGSERSIPSRNLSTAKVSPTFVVSTRFPADDSSQGYERSISVSKAWDEATTSAAFEVANHVLKRIDRLAGTRAGDPARSTKLTAFAAKFVAAAFRRPLTADETQRYVTNLMTGVADPEAALRRVVLLALKSPRFLYVELAAGPSAAPPPAETVATRLAFALWDSVPDPALAQAAAQRHLLQRTDVTAQARRMLADPRARAKLREFFQQWLQLRYVDDLQKDAQLFPDFSPDLIDDLRASLSLFIDQVVWSESSDYRELLRADYLYANDRMARFYGLPAPATSELVRVTAPAGQRSGVLTHPYLLAALSYKTSSSPIHRGVFLTRSIVGRTLKAPPMAQAFDEASFEQGMTMREKVVKLTRSENCQGCHAVINPLGFSLEWYDAVGRYRATENGRPIDAVSTYTGDEDEKIRLAGPRDVADFALANERASQAFIEQLFHHVLKQPVMAFGPDTIMRLRDSFVASHYNIQHLFAEIATLAALRGVEPVTVAATSPPPMTTLHRREFIRRTGFSAALLPFIVGLPSLALAAPARPRQRLIIVFSPNGTIPPAFWPDQIGRDFQLKEILSPLTPYRERMLTLHGLSNKVRGDGDGHMRGMSCLLTGIELLPGNIKGGSGQPAGWASGISIDQELKNFFQSRELTRTRFGSLEFGVGVQDRADPWTRMSYAGSGKPVAPISDPYQMHEKLYGQMKDRESLRSVLDPLKAELAKVRTMISAEDRRVLEEHESLVRQLEREIADNASRALLVSPPDLDHGVADQNDNVPRLSRMQIDLLVNSFVNDMARVATLQYTKSVGGARMNWLDITDGHHGLSHEPDTDKVAQEKLIKINTWFAGEVRYLADKLAATPEPGATGSMLDHTLIVWTNELGKGNSHTLDNIPFVLLGGGFGFDMGRALKFEKVPHNRLHLALAHGAGHRLETFGKSDLCSGGPLALA